MSYVIAAPEYVAAAATDLASIGSAVSDASAFALGPTTGAAIPAGADTVSAEISALFAAHAEAFQALSAQAAAFHDQFVQLMSLGGQQYALSEATNLASFQTGSINLPQQTLSGHLTDQTTQLVPTTGAIAHTVAITSTAAAPALAAAPTGSVGSLGGLGSVGGMGSAVAAGSVGSVGRQPVPPLPAGSTTETEISSPAPVTALPAALATRATPTAALAPEPAAPRQVTSQEAGY